VIARDFHHLGEAVGLLDQSDGEALRLRRFGRCHQIRCLDSTASPVTENERRARIFGRT